MPKVILIENGTFQEIQIGQELTIGRAYSNLLRLEGEEISRVHAIVYRRGAEYVLRDLDSKNGVLINGQKCSTMSLQPGDEIQLGKYILLFDPEPDFDLTEFLRKHNVNPPEEITADPEEIETGFVLRDNKRKFAELTVPAKEEAESIFFTQAEVEAMADSLPADTSPEFLGELLRMQRQLTCRPLASPEEEGALYQHFLEAAVSALKADRGVIVLRDDSAEILRLGAIMPLDKDVAVNRVVLRSALREHSAVLCNDVQHDERFLKTETVIKERIASLIAYPLMREDVAVGLLYADVQERPQAFRREQLLILQFVARLLVMCMERAQARK